MNKRSFNYKSTDKRKSGRSNKQSNATIPTHLINQAENSAKREFRKRETKNKNKRNSILYNSFIHSLPAVCAKSARKIATEAERST